MTLCTCYIERERRAVYDREEFDPPILLSERTSVARKEYPCLYGDTIKPGEKYFRRAYMFDGEFHFERMHNSYEN